MELYATNECDTATKSNINNPCFGTEMCLTFPNGQIRIFFLSQNYQVSLIFDPQKGKAVKTERAKRSNKVYSKCYS